MKYISIHVPPVPSGVGPVGVAWEGTLTYFTMVDPQNPKPQRVFGPKTADHPALGFALQCHKCGAFLREGDMTTLVPVGPGDDDEAQALAREGQPHRQVALEVHVECSDGHAGSN